MGCKCSNVRKTCRGVASEAFNSLKNFNAAEKQAQNFTTENDNTVCNNEEIKESHEQCEISHTHQCMQSLSVSSSSVAPPAVYLKSSAKAELCDSLKFCEDDEQTKNFSCLMETKIQEKKDCTPKTAPLKNENPEFLINNCKTTSASNRIEIAEPVNAEDKIVVLESASRSMIKNCADVFDHPKKIAVVSDRQVIAKLDVDNTIKKLCQLTNTSSEEAWIALTSCNYDVDSALGVLCEGNNKNAYFEALKLSNSSSNGFNNLNKVKRNKRENFNKDLLSVPFKTNSSYSYSNSTSTIFEKQDTHKVLLKLNQAASDSKYSLYHDLAIKQDSILPHHLKHSSTISEILLESSIIGKYIMLPWNEDDSDILANFWCSASLPSNVESVAAHSHLPPYFCNNNSAESEKNTKNLVLSDFGLLPVVTKCNNLNYESNLANPGLEVGKKSNHPSGFLSLFLNEKEKFDNLSTKPFINHGGWVGDKWIDPDGVMELSKKQQQRFHAWKRITEVISDPCIIADKPNSRSIRQGFVGDCSFLSSLAVLAEFENRHQIPVLSGILYPQVSHPSDPNRIIPIVNHRGMYACRLFFNGVPRKVLIDDYVPVRKDGKLLSAHSSNKREAWVTLLEKSFVKLMGGSYFMQGSNPGADLYHLTGWIPETVPFRSDIQIGSPDTHQPIVTGNHDESATIVSDPKWDLVWEQLYLGLVEGRCIACLGTSEVADAAPSGLEFPEGVSISSGIVARHAYSVLNCHEINGLRLMYVKNPWGCIRWTGRFSTMDKDSWTSDLKAALRYNLANHIETDNGCFWIEWSDVVKWFSHLYICWNNTCYPYQSEIHSKWDRSKLVQNSCLADDSHLVAYNPQFRITIQPSASHCLKTQKIEVWTLLSRHVRERKRDLSQKYLAVHVHIGNERVTCPPPPAKQGVYSNGECTLVKLTIGGNGGDAFTNLEYVLVVSQYSQKDEFNFTLRVYSYVHTSIEQLKPLIPDDWQSLYFRGKWSESTAGGCSNDLWSYFKNPHLRLDIPQATEVILFLESPQEYSVNLRIFKGRVTTARQLRTGKAMSSGPYRAGCCIIRTTLEEGIYTLVTSTFRPGEYGEFQLCLHIPSNVKLPVISWLPYPYAIPPQPHFFYQIVANNKDFEGPIASRICLTALSKITLVSLCLQILFISPQNAWPSMMIYKLNNDSISSKSLNYINEQEQLFTLNGNNSNCRSPKSAYPLKQVRLKAEELQLVMRSDLEGGLSGDGRTTSSAAQDLYLRQGIVNISLVEINSEIPYFIYICSLHNEDVCGSYKLHIISNKKVEAYLM